MSESTTPVPDPARPQETPPSSSASLTAAKLVLALLGSVAAVTLAYRGLTTNSEDFKDPVAAQAALDRADTVVSVKEEIQGEFRVKKTTHKSGKVDTSSEPLKASTAPNAYTPPGSSSPKGNGKAAPAKKKAEDAKEE